MKHYYLCILVVSCVKLDIAGTPILFSNSCPSVTFKFPCYQYLNIGEHGLICNHIILKFHKLHKFHFK